MLTTDVKTGQLLTTDVKIGELLTTDVKMGKLLTADVKIGKLLTTDVKTGQLLTTDDKIGQLLTTYIINVWKNLINNWCWNRSVFNKLIFTGTLFSLLESKLFQPKVTKQ